MQPQHARHALAVVGQPLGELIADILGIPRSPRRASRVGRGPPALFPGGPLLHPAPLAVSPADGVGVAQVAEVPLQRQIAPPGLLVLAGQFLADRVPQLLPPELGLVDGGPADVDVGQVTVGQHHPLQLGVFQDGAFKVDPRQDGPPQVGALEPGSPEVGLPQHGAPQVSPRQVRAPEVGLRKDGFLEVGPCQDRAFQPGTPQVGALEVSRFEDGPGAVDEPQGGTLQVGVLEHGSREVGPTEHGTPQVSPRQVRALQVGLFQPRPLEVGPTQQGLPQVGFRQVGGLQVGQTQAGTPQVGATEAGPASLRVPPRGAGRGLSLAALECRPAQVYPVQDALQAAAQQAAPAALGGAPRSAGAPTRPSRSGMRWPASRTPARAPGTFLTRRGWV